MNRFVKMFALSLVLSAFGEVALYADANKWRSPSFVCVDRILECTKINDGAKAKEAAYDWCGQLKLIETEATEKCLTLSPPACTDDEVQKMNDLLKCDSKSQSKCATEVKTCIADSNYTYVCDSLTFDKKVSEGCSMLSTSCKDVKVVFQQYIACGLTGWLPSNDCVTKAKKCIVDNKLAEVAGKEDKCKFLDYKKDKVDVMACLTTGDNSCTKDEYMKLRQLSACGGASAVALSLAALLVCLMAHLFGK